MLAAIAVVAVVLTRGGGADYVVHARFDNASQLVRGNDVQVAGTRIGAVEAIELTDEGGADVKLKIEKPGYTPLRRGTRAIIRLQSLSGVANRYVDLQLAGAGEDEIPDGGRIEANETTSAVDLDQFLSTFDERTREDLQGVVQGFGKQYRGKSAEASRGWLYLNPSLAASSRLFEELTYDKPALERFLAANAGLVSDLAERRDDLAGVVDNLAEVTTAVGSRKAELAESIGRLPPFMRRANTTFVNLRAALDQLRPLVRDSKPVARRLRPFFAELRPLARDARPTVNDLAAIIRRPGAGNDLIELTRGQVPLRDIATRDVEANGRTRKGAFPETVDALRTSIPELGYARPYAVDLTGWFDDFGHSGIYDALGGISRVGTYVNAFGQLDGVLRPIPLPQRPTVGEFTTRRDQRNRCPGAAEHPADDGSNPWRPTPDHNCDPTQVLPGK